MIEEIIIYSDRIPMEEVKAALEADAASQDIQLEWRSAATDSRVAAETVVLVAIVTGVTRLLVGLLKLAQARDARKLVVHGKSGWEVEIPADTPPDIVKQYINKAKEQDVELVEFF